MCVTVIESPQSKWFQLPWLPSLPSPLPPSHSSLLLQLLLLHAPVFFPGCSSSILLSTPSPTSRGGAVSRPRRFFPELGVAERYHLFLLGAANVVDSKVGSWLVADSCPRRCFFGWRRWGGAGGFSRGVLLLDFCHLSVRLLAANVFCCFFFLVDSFMNLCYVRGN